MSNFAFLQAEWPDLHEAAGKSEQYALGDPRSACFYARRALKLAVDWLFDHDPVFRPTYQRSLGAMIAEPTFRHNLPPGLHPKAALIQRVGNRAVHSTQSIAEADARQSVVELHHFLFWVARTYTLQPEPMRGDVVFDLTLLPPPAAEVIRRTTEQLQALEAQLQAKDEQLAEARRQQAGIDEELARLRAEIAEAKRRNEQVRDGHDYSEAQTRDYFIDLLLKEAGWAQDQPRDKEFPVEGMPNNEGKGFVDDVLWGDDGLPLALNESKRTKRDPRVGQQQAKLYADCLEKRFGQRPIIFYSNGYEHWIWDDTFYPPRPVQGFYKKAELELLIQRRKTRKPLPKAEINPAIIDRYYQIRGARRVCEAFEVEHVRKTLLVMATGGGKTRLAIALNELLMRCNWVKRALFLADRVALVNQAVNAFKKHLPEASPVNLVTDKEAEVQGYLGATPRVHAEILFRRPVAGPLLLGRGALYGLWIAASLHHVNPGRFTLLRLCVREGPLFLIGSLTS